MKSPKILLREYQSTLFIPKVVKDVNIQWPADFWIITACNPYSSGDRDGDLAATKQLRRELSQSGCWKVSLSAVSADWTHMEKSFAVSGLNREQMIALGAKYKQNALFHVVKDTLSIVSCNDGDEIIAGVFSERLRAMTERPGFRIYVVRLSDEVLQVKRFRDANPNYKPGKSCFYVGMTGRTPEERLAQHRAGYKSCSLVKNYGRHLAKKKFENIPLLNYSDAQRMEISHAEELRLKGFAVWQK